MKRLMLICIVLIVLFLMPSKRINVEDMQGSIPRGSLLWFGSPSAPELGQVVLISNPLDPSQERLVRIVATQGHQIAFQRGIFLLNGVQFHHTDMKTDGENHRIYKESVWDKDREKSWLIKVPNETKDVVMAAMVVPADHVFVACDNRASCLDSRWWGSIPTASIQRTLRAQLTIPDELHPFFQFYPSGSD